MATIDLLLSEIHRFDPRMRQIFEPASYSAILQLESSVGFGLPGDYKDFLMLTNGLIVYSDVFYGIHSGNAMLDVYTAYVRETTEVDNPMWYHLLPICPDGFGNHYCLDLNTCDSALSLCNVVFWQHDYEYGEDDIPEIDTYSFAQFLKERIEFIREDIG